MGESKYALWLRTLNIDVDKCIRTNLMGSTIDLMDKFLFHKYPFMLIDEDDVRIWKVKPARHWKYKWPSVHSFILTAILTSIKVDYPLIMGTTMTGLVNGECDDLICMYAEEILSKASYIKDKGIIYFKQPILVKAQSSRNRDYGNIYIHGELFHQGDLYGETDPYFIIGCYIRCKLLD